MTAYPMGPGDREEEDVRRSENEGFGQEAEVQHDGQHPQDPQEPFLEDERTDGYLADERTDGVHDAAETPQDDLLVASADPVHTDSVHDEPVHDDTPADDPLAQDLVTEDAPVVAAVPDDRPDNSTEIDRPLFDDGFGDQFKQRWQEVQSGFVDDPYETVRQAEQLADEIVSNLTNALTERKRELDDRWSNEKDNTEELRQSLRGYRTLLDRLLAL